MIRLRIFDLGRKLTEGAAVPFETTAYFDELAWLADGSFLLLGTMNSMHLAR